MIYTDGVHLVADSLEELHKFASKVGLNRRYFEGVRKKHPHYDLTNERVRNLSIEFGAIEITSREVLIKSKLIK
jgi:hypothetical protein